MVYAVNITVALPPVLTRRDILPFDLALYESLGPIFGVALPAFLVMASMHGQDGVRDLTRRCLRWQVGFRWYLVALFSMPIVVMLCASVIFGLTPLNALVEKWQLLFTVVLPQLLLLIVFFIVAEEVGWMGLLQARLQDRHGPLRASVMVTVPFALYHLPVVMNESELGLAQLPLALGFVYILGISQLFGWRLLGSLVKRQPASSIYGIAPSSVQANYIFGLTTSLRYHLMVYAAIAFAPTGLARTHRRVMSHQQRKPVEKDQKFAEAVRKYLAGEPLSRTEERIIAYGYTAATRGQRFLSSREDPSVPEKEDSPRQPGG
jgi:membrane protease YdiL (CAAX protease family)